MIKINNLNIVFERKVIASNITLTFEENKKYILLGKNGSGKSTLMKEIFKASIIGDENIEVSKAKAFYSDNDSMESFSQFSGLEYLGAYFDDYYGEDWFKDEVIDFNYFNISIDMLSTPIAMLSGGERRILNIIVCLYGDFDILFIDELESNLDQNKLEKSIVKLNELCKNKIVVIATHNQTILDKLKYEKAFKFVDRRLEDITEQVEIDNSLKSIFGHEKGVIDENFEF